MNLRRLINSVPAIRGVQSLRQFLPSNYRRILTGVTVMALATGVCEAALLGILGSLAATLEGGEGVSTIDLPLIGDASWQAVLIGGWVAALAVVVLRYLNARVLSRLSLDAMVQMRAGVIDAFLESSALKQQSERAGELQDLLVNHAPRSSLILMHSATAIVSSAMLFVLTLSAAVVNVRVFLGMALVISVVLVLTIPVQRYAQRRGKELSELMISYASDVSEIGDSATQIRLFNAAATMSERVDRSSRHKADLMHRVRVVQLTNPTMYRTLVLALLLSALAALIASGTTELASAGTGALLMIRALMESQIVHRMSLKIAEGVPFPEEVKRRIAAYRDEQVVYGERELQPIQVLEINDLGFAYEGEDGPTISSTSLVIERGAKVGIVGPSGSGKSTFLSLLLGLLEPTHGTIRYNGDALSEFSARSRAREISVVTQVPLILHETVEQNIRFFRDWISDDDVTRAAEAAGITTEIGALPDGFQTVIGDRGARALSGGQRQRLCIARALAGQPSLLILDEPTSSLDLSAEEIVADTVATLGDDCSVLVVSHRDTALKACDRRFEMQAGRLVELTPTTPIAEASSSSPR